MTVIYVKEIRSGRSSLEYKSRKRGMHDRKHRHAIKLMEYNHSRDGDVCIRCRKGILCKSTVYTCGSATTSPSPEKCAFFLHQNCASPRLFLHPKDKQFLSLVSSNNCLPCDACDRQTEEDYLYCSGECESHFCMNCPLVDAGREMIQHWSHQHPLRLVERYATFECDACNQIATDYSYMCDINCPFWIHKSCAILPLTHSFGIHRKHPLTLSDSMPQIYRRFYQFCKICKATVHPSHWLYYCGSCRIFVHVHCALSKIPAIRQEDCSDDDPKLMHLPAPDEPSMNFIMKNCIKGMISLLENTAIAPSHHLNHWSHQHALSLKKRSDVFTIDDDSNQELRRLIICDCCTKPISSLDDTEVFYECSQCNYSLHRYCAQFPKVMQHRVIGMLKGIQPSVFSNDTFCCNCCKVYSNGLQMFQPEKGFKLDVWCACLPQKIKHQAHHHPLENHKMSDNCLLETCEACLVSIYPFSLPFVFGCISCSFYLHVNCLLKPATIKHRWDPHPLRLVRSVEDDVVEDHPHEFECEFCSKEIDTNTWFYHCSICDLSFHLNNCINPYNAYSNVKLGAINIKNNAHPHELTFVLNKNKKRPPCGSCSQYTTGELILECKLCNFVMHSHCKK